MFKFQLQLELRLRSNSGMVEGGMTERADNRAFETRSELFGQACTASKERIGIWAGKSRLLEEVARGLAPSKKNLNWIDAKPGSGGISWESLSMRERERIASIALGKDARTRIYYQCRDSVSVLESGMRLRQQVGCRLSDNTRMSRTGQLNVQQRIAAPISQYIQPSASGGTCRSRCRARHVEISGSFTLKEILELRAYDKGFGWTFASEATTEQQDLTSVLECDLLGSKWIGCAAHCARSESKTRIKFGRPDGDGSGSQGSGAEVVDRRWNEHYAWNLELTDWNAQIDSKE
ncbi:hypothetical protein C8R47DRAFT_1192073 [Mycena vitilis]|nr:hypothetical protein C8R47DRAFT_1192073 [Mycena vitilis]